MRARIWLLALMSWLGPGTSPWFSAARAEDFFFQVPWSELKLVDAEVVEPILRQIQKTDFLRGGPREVVLEGGGEAFFVGPPTDAPWQNREPVFGDFRIIGWLPQSRVALRDADTLAGRLVVPATDPKQRVVLKFTAPFKVLQPHPQHEFFFVRAQRCAALAQRNIPGAAWFRHQADLSRRSSGPLTFAEQERLRQLDATRLAQRFASEDRQHALITGGRAVSENLQLDRPLPNAVGVASKQLVPLDQIQGITIKEFDWQPLLKDPRPALDPLAGYIAADQYAVFFPSFTAALEVIDEARRQGSALLSQWEPPTEDRHLVERYERQLGLSLNGLSRLLGLKLISSVAVTGGDPDFASGTDVAVLFETSQPDFLSQMLLTQSRVDAVFHPGVDRMEGSIDGLAFRGVRSSDRRLCCYVVELENVVFVTNSPAQISRLASVRAQRAAAISSLKEYHFFRQRYVLKDEAESALLFVSDAAIRRWCGPHWRIAQARRTRDAAGMWDLQAEHLATLVAKSISKPVSVTSKWNLTQAHDFVLTSQGIESPQLGRLDFLTPISEMKFDQVTLSERQAYERWRDGYQRNWSGAFDPIALRVGVSPERLSADLTIMPLIVNSRYRWLVQLVDGAKLTTEAGTAHDTLMQLTMALNPKSQFMQQINLFAKSFLIEKDKQLAADPSFEPLGWIGDWAGLYADFDAYWLELQQLSSGERYQKLQADGYAMPIAIQVAVRDPQKQLPKFLAGLRAFAEGPMRFNTQWEPGTYRDVAFEKVSQQDNKQKTIAWIFLATIGDVFIATPNEGLLKRAIDRHVERQVVRPNAASRSQPSTVLGESLAVSLAPHAPSVATWFRGNSAEIDWQQESWNNLVILNEWKRRFPDRDPLDVHRRFWNSELLCPGGGQYVWNEEWQTMESMVYGHPAQPKRPALGKSYPALFKHLDAGLTFELGGLRARVEVQRAKPGD